MALDYRILVAARGFAKHAMVANLAVAGGRKSDGWMNIWII